MPTESPCEATGAKTEGMSCTFKREAAPPQPQEECRAQPAMVFTAAATSAATGALTGARSGNPVGVIAGAVAGAAMGGAGAMAQDARQIRECQARNMQSISQRPSGNSVYGSNRGSGLGFRR